MPLMHAENSKLTGRCVNEFLKLLQKVKERSHEIYTDGTGDYLQRYIKFSQDHNATIELFGRYPHRNHILGRESTQAEKEYLANAAKYAS